jgi:cytochrome P450
VPTKFEDVPQSLVVDFDIFDESIVPGVHERLAEIQATTPLAYCPRHGGYWMATTYEDVYEVIRNDDVFSAVETALTLGAQPPQLPPLHFDPPEHTDYRTLLNPVFNPTRMRELEDDMRATARSLLGGFADKGSCEFIREFAHPLPTQTFLSLMGWPRDDLPMLADWAELSAWSSSGAPTLTTTT